MRVISLHVWMDVIVTVPMWLSWQYNAMLQSMDACYDEDCNMRLWGWGMVDDVVAACDLEVRWSHN